MNQLNKNINFISQFRIKFFPQIIIRNKKLKNKIILFYPGLPHHRTVIYKICRSLGVKIINTPDKQYDIFFSWDDNTFSLNNSLNNYNINSSVVTINSGCIDISKNNVDEKFKIVFGYSLLVDPISYSGECVIKSDMNAMHDGKIIKCPVDEAAKDVVYQKIIDNSFDENYVKDIRVPVFKDSIPFVYFKFKKHTNRFTNKVDHVEVHKTEEIFTKLELNNILSFAEKIKLNYGELDVLRDNKDGKIYIIDVNKTPWGPPATISKEKYKITMKIMTEVFIEKFLK